MSANMATLVHRHIFGFKSDVSSAAAFVDENVVAFAAGHNVVIHHTETKQQKFIQANPGTQGITAIALSHDQRYVAIAEESDRGMVTVYDQRTLKRKKRLNSPDVESSRVVSVAFSVDSKLLLTLGGAPDWRMVCWAWEKGKTLAVVQVSADPAVPALQCAFNPVDMSMCSTTGNGILRFFRIQDGEFKAMPSIMGDREPQAFLSHAWLIDNPENVVVGTAAGEILLFTSGELVGVLPTSPQDGTAIRTIAAYSKGFVCGGDRGTVMLFERSDIDSEPYVRSKRFAIPGPESAAVVSLSVSPHEGSLVVATSANQLFTFKLADAEHLSEGETHFTPLIAPLHENLPDVGAAITGMDVCVRKPLVVTAGVDRTVRIWNYHQRKLEQMKRFPDDISSIAIHPSGLHLLVGFADKLRVMNVLMDDIRPVAALPAKACRECAFSNGGHLFAAATNNLIVVYNTYTCEQLASLRGHNGRVQSLTWMEGDRYLVSAGIDGGLYQWDILTGKREGEFVNKQCHFTSAAATESVTMGEGAEAYAVGDDSTIKKIDFPGSSAGGGGGGQISREVPVDAKLSQLAMSPLSQMFFVAVGENRPKRPGAIRSYKFPLTSAEHKPTEYQALSSAVTRMRLSHDDQHLFAAGVDGALIMFDVREQEGRLPRRDREGGAAPSEEILVTRSDLEDRQNLMAELKNKVVELKSQTDYQLHLKDMEHTERIKEVTDKYMQQVEQDKNRFELLREEKTDMEMEFDETIKHMEEKHQHKLQEMEADYQKKIMEEVERYQQLVSDRDGKQEQQDYAQRRMIEEHKSEVKEVTERYEEQLARERGLRTEKQAERHDMDRRHGEWMEQLEEDVDQEVEELRARYESKLQAERNQMLGYRGENGLMKKRFSALSKDIEDKKEELRLMMETATQLHGQMDSLNADIKKRKQAIAERDRTIGEKERQIYELKKENQELEKFKFVLDNKIKTLKQRIDPLDNTIADRKEQIKEMDKDLEDFHKSNAQLDLMIGELRKKLDAMQLKIKRQRQRINDQTGLIGRIRSDLHECAQYIQDPRDLRECVARLFKAHVREDVEVERVDADIQREYQRQQEYLEMSVASLKKKLSKDSSLHSADNMRVMQENMALIREIHDLRNEMQAIRALQQRAKQQGPTSRRKPTASRPGSLRSTLHGSRPPSAGRRRAGKSDAHPATEETMAELSAGRDELSRLKGIVRTAEQSVTMSRPASRKRLPPIDGALPVPVTPSGGR